MKSKRQLKKEHGTKRKFQLPTKTEGLMICIMLMVIWFAWGQFQFQSEEHCETPCNSECCSL